MERWCLEMGLKPDVSEQVRKNIQQLTGHSDLELKNAWQHVIKCVRPKKEAEMIKKQLLLHKLQRTKLNNIQVPVNCLNEYNNYLKFKDNHETLKSLQSEIKQKKNIIKVHLENLESSKEKSMNFEEELKENIFKLNQLQNKKITVSRFINKLEHCQKLLTIIKEPNNILGLDFEETGYGPQILSTVKDLPKGFERETLLLKLIDLIEELKFNPVPYWDRTEVLTSMEKLLLHLNKKLKSSEISFTDENLRADGRIDLTFFSKKIEADPEEISEVLNRFKEDVLIKAEEGSNTLIASKQPYTLDVLRSNARRLQRLINEKAEEIKSVPLKSKEISNEIISSAPVIDLPPHIPVENLYNSLSIEVDLFMKMQLSYSNPSKTKFENLRLDYIILTESRMLDDMAKLQKLVSIMEKISDFEIPGPENYIETKENMKASYSAMSQSLETCEKSLSRTVFAYKRLKEAYDFWRKEPLNKKLTGIEVEGKDIRHWLNCYFEIKAQLEHEKWLKEQQTISYD